MLLYDRFVFRLPIGGFSALHPNLTVVRKELPVQGRGRPDDYLPSCSTCQVYLKLPQYSSEAIMRQKLLQAMTLGSASFRPFVDMLHKGSLLFLYTAETHARLYLLFLNRTRALRDGLRLCAG